MRLCNRCDGRGWLIRMDRVESECPDCEGTGEHPTQLMVAAEVCRELIHDVVTTARAVLRSI